jgi:hypothetical protein
MTEDIEQGLALLAREAEPATVDADAVIARARGQARRRRTTTATAFAMAVALGAVAVVLGTTEPATDPAAESARLADRLTEQLAAAAPKVIPAHWQPAEFVAVGDGPTAGVFRCAAQSSRGRHNETCYTGAVYRDDLGTVDLRISVSSNLGLIIGPCMSMDCVETSAPDGTDVQITTGMGPGYELLPHVSTLTAIRPDGTHVTASVHWKDERTAPPLSTAEFMPFATIFSI